MGSGALHFGRDGMRGAGAACAREAGQVVRSLFRSGDDGWKLAASRFHFPICDEWWPPQGLRMRLHHRRSQEAVDAAFKQGDPECGDL
jgi:hypothetical protein